MLTEAVSRRSDAWRARWVIALAAVRLLLLPWDSPAAEGLTARLAIVGDYGTGGREEGEVAALVSSWDPDAVVTCGDNNYPEGAEETIDSHIGRYYHGFIGGYSGRYGEGADENRFFPSLGNHDWITTEAAPYLDYFKLPGNERYYDVAFGPVRVFIVDSDPREPDGTSATSKQADWLRRSLSEATEPWKLVVFHHAPYSSGKHGPCKWMRWPFREWGATAVIAGHDHNYERIMKDGFPYFVNGFGGAKLRRFKEPVDGSQVRFASDHGAMRVDASQERIRFQAVTADGEVVDTYELPRR